MGAIYGYDIPPKGYWDTEEDMQRAEEAYWADWDLREELAMERRPGID